MKLQVPSILLHRGEPGCCFKAVSPVAVLVAWPFISILTPITTPLQGGTQSLPVTCCWHFSLWSSPVSWTGVSVGLLEKYSEKSDLHGSPSRSPSTFSKWPWQRQSIVLKLLNFYFIFTSICMDFNCGSLKYIYSDSQLHCVSGEKWGWQLPKERAVFQTNCSASILAARCISELHCCFL